jgi:hypothetical protein
LIATPSNYFLSKTRKYSNTRNIPEREIPTNKIIGSIGLSERSEENDHLVAETLMH